MCVRAGNTCKISVPSTQFAVSLTCYKKLSLQKKTIIFHCFYGNPDKIFSQTMIKEWTVIRGISRFNQGSIWLGAYSLVAGRIQSLINCQTMGLSSLLVTGSWLTSVFCQVALIFTANTQEEPGEYTSRVLVSLLKILYK